MDAVDWGATEVGPPSSWPQSLRTALGIMSDSGFPMVVMWGPELILFYNDSYAPMLGVKHPWAMGRALREVWPEIWDTIGPMLDGVLHNGVATYSEDLLLPLFRNGYLEECYFTFSFSPITDDGTVCGIFCAVVETTRNVIGHRRLNALQTLETRSLSDVGAASPIDLPFLRIYLSDGRGSLALSESSGTLPAAEERWPVDEVARSGCACLVPSTIAATATLGESRKVESAIVLPLLPSGQRPAIGAMVVGLSPFSPLDEEYRQFLELVSARIASEINGARAIVSREQAATEAEDARDAAMESERVLRMLADAVPQIICTAEANGAMDYFNRRWFEFTGLSARQTFEDNGWLDVLHPDDRAAVAAGWHAAAQAGEDFSAEARICSRSGEYCWFLMRAVAVRDDDGAIARLFGTATDINDRKQIEERESFLSHVSEVLGSTLDARTVLQRITELCVPAFADWCQVQSLSADDELVVEAVRHSDPERNKRLEGLVGRSVVAMRDDVMGSPQVLRQARSSALDHEATLRAVRENVLDPEDRAIYEDAGLGTALIVPLIARGTTQGTLHLVSMDPASVRPAIAMEIAEDLARRAALAIDNSRLYEREHRVATALQHAMLPAHLPTHPRIELSYAYRPAERESRVGGDWYDAFVVSDGRMGISIGDVAGHGLEASVAMNEARQALRLSALEGLSPAQTLRRANVALMLNDEHPMITAIYGVIDVERATFRYSCAGHPPPALAPFFGEARYLKGGGIPMGVDLGARFPSLEVALEPYSTLLLYTDGLIEFDRNLEREAARLLEALSGRVQDMSSDGAGALLRYVLNNRQLDDIAVLAATILPASPEMVEITLPAAPSSATIARRFVSRYARVAQLEPQRSFDLVIAVGEAVANAVEHAYRGATGDFVLRLGVSGDKIVGEVRDLGTWRERTPSPERGRGLAILRATTRRFDLRRSPEGTTVAFAV
jgi:PAS domain S-box-containing protein